MGTLTKEQRVEIEAELTKIKRLLKAIGMARQGAGPLEISTRLSMSTTKARYIVRQHALMDVLVRSRQIILNRALNNRTDEQMMSELLAIPLTRCLVRQSPDDKGSKEGDDVFGRSLDDGLISWSEYKRLVSRRFTSFRPNVRSL